MHIDGFMYGVQINTQALSGLSLNEVTSRLSPGDVIRAQILEIVANEVLLKLFDSTTVKASIPDDFDGEIGKFKNFIVKESLPDRLVLEEQKRTAQKVQKQDGDILKALSKIGVSETDENINIAKVIKENNLPLTKEIFDNTNRLIKSNSSLDIPKAIFMEANKINATPLSIKQLGLLEKGSLSLGSQLNELVSLLDASTESLPDNNQKVSQNQNLDSSKNIQKAYTENNSLEEGSIGNITNSKNSLIAEGTLQKNIDANNINNSRELIEDKKAFDAKSFLKLIEDKMKQTDETNIKDNFDNNAKLVDQEPSALANKGVSKEKTDNLTKNLKSEIDKLFIKLENLENDKSLELEKNIKSMGEKLQNIKEEVVNLNLNNKDVILQQIDNILNQMRFINDIRSFGYYIPIPVKLNGVLEQADLYVLKRNKNKKVNPEDATVFLALDTSNMGRVETLLVVNKRNISLNIRIEAKEYEDYIRTRFVDLYNMLASQGYKLTDIKYRQINEPINMFNVNKVVNELISTNSSGLDVRL